MKFIKWRTLVTTGLVCLLPILLGVLLWKKLPEVMAIHFDVYGTPDNYASKEFVVFGLPLLMLLVQVFCCFINDLNAYKHGERKKFETATKWIVPCMTVILQSVTLCYGLGWNIDMRKVTAVLVGVVFVVVGNYLPKFDYIKNKDIEAEKARKINRFIGYVTVLMGALFFVSAFLPPVSTIVCLWLFIPYGIIGTVYGIVVGRK